MLDLVTNDDLAVIRLTALGWLACTAHHYIVAILGLSYSSSSLISSNRLQMTKNCAMPRERHITPSSDILRIFNLRFRKCDRACSVRHRWHTRIGQIRHVLWKPHRQIQSLEDCAAKCQGSRTPRRSTDQEGSPTTRCGAISKQNRRPLENKVEISTAFASFRYRLEVEKWLV